MPFSRSDEPDALTERDRLRAALERTRPCVKESLDHWDKLLLAQEKVTRSNAQHMLPDHYINTLRDQVSSLSVLLSEIDVLLEQRGADTCEHLYAARAGSPVGDGICIKCGAQESPDESSDR